MAEPGDTATTREERLALTFVELADTLTDDFDVIAFLDNLARRAVELLDLAAVGLMLTDHEGRLHVMAASDEQARLLDLFQLQNEEGPCLDSFRSGFPVIAKDLEREGDRWPRASQAALANGFHAVAALPLRLRDQVIGAMNLLSAEPGRPGPREVAVGQAFADVATIGILQQRALQEQHLLAEQLQTALNSRIIIEQAKGVLAARRNIDMEAAFALLRDRARSTNRRLSELAAAVVRGKADVADLLAGGQKAE
ncbi:ANTAR domain-containing protein [Actinomadura rupiterrae]|uniref:ANTAR domain-containing protein n=1 Tax=Actinomadura rupiterrae TaxID=559627 RepID=UPI0020A34434|nr:GAF and ANTAR domain-containing protein [Actinomadura rupiterrae]MCP2336344.1 GAF domain-containing protein [Actinomadura rupiterrae]